MKWLIAAILAVAMTGVASAGPKFEFNFGARPYGGYYTPYGVTPGYGYYDQYGNYIVVPPRPYYGPPRPYYYYGPEFGFRIGPSRDDRDRDRERGGRRR